MPTDNHFEVSSGAALRLSVLPVGLLIAYVLVTPISAVAQEPVNPTPSPSPTITPQPEPPPPFDPSGLQPGQSLRGEDYPALPLPTPEPPFVIQAVPQGVDLDVTVIRRDPKYSAYWVDYPGGTGHKPILHPGTENDKRWPDPGEVVTFTAHVGNKGTLSSGPFAYKWYIDGAEVESGTLGSLAPGSSTTTSYQWAWAHQMSGERVIDDHIVRFVVDPEDQIDETFESNNQLEDRTNALSLLIAITPEIYQSLNQAVRPDIPHSAEDWLQKHIEALNDALAGSAYSFLPHGATERVRIDEIVVTPTNLRRGLAYDGGWFVNSDYRYTSGWYDPATDIDWGLVHELSHQLGLIDLYRYNVEYHQINVLRTDGSIYNERYWQYNPGIMGGGDTFPHNNPRLYSSHSAGGISTNKGYRRGYYGEYQFDIAPEIWIEVRDETGYPVAGVEVSLYQRLPLYRGRSEEIDNTREIAGVTDGSGRFLLPNRSVDGTLTTATGHTLRDNPFGVVDVVGPGNLFLIKFSKDGYEDFQWLPLLDLNLYYWANDAPSSQTILHEWKHPYSPVTLVNGDFEAGFYLLEGQSIANGWAPYTFFGQPTFAGERTTVHSGRWAYKISGYAPFNAGLAQVVPVLPGRAYRVATYYQLYPPGDGQAFLVVQDGTSAAQWVGDSWPGAWRSLSQVVTPTSGWLTISLHGSIGADPNTNVYFDDVTVAAVGSP